ncbi:hypothetical protein [Bifidobacterium thermophilum]|uniref:hypothetical protein n=1 Tax=Bifidobacterium thermophilum TaxID=33905 RepID=UPI0030AFF4C9
MADIRHHPQGVPSWRQYRGRDYRFTAPNLKSRVDIGYYLKNPRLILDMFRTLTFSQMLKVLSHEKVWDGNAMYTHHMDMGRKECSGITTMHSEAGSRSYLLSPVIPAVQDEAAQDEAVPVR